MKFSQLQDISRVELSVIISGVVSMGLEILAGRIIAPEFGSSIYTWGSIIGVSMFALSLGYHYGGKTSQKAGIKDLERYLVCTSGYILFIMYFGEQILLQTSAIPINPIYAPIIPVTLLFGPPTYFLGYISPYAAQLSQKETKGEASGHFYAIGTAGSIIGAFGTTFLLIPNLPVNQIYILFAGLTALPLIKSSITLRAYFLPAIVIFGVTMSQNPVSAKNVIYEDETPYQSLKVTQENSINTLYLEGQPQTRKYINSTQTPSDYPEYFYLPYLMRENIENALFIGGGGFLSPQQFAENGVKVDAVELDPGVVKAAEKHFNLSETENLSVYTMDGREFLEQTNNTYDLIVLDAYRKDKVPFHMTTQEFFDLAYRKTDEDGVVASNIISAPLGPASRFSKSYYKTINEEFRSMYYFKTRNSSSIQNIEILGSKSPKLSQEELEDRAENFTLRNLSDEVKNLKKVDAESAQILTDDYAPVEKLLSPMAGRSYTLS
jgi:spermidine synthase